MALNRRAVSKPSGKLRKTPTQLEFSKNIGLTYHGTETLKPSTQRALKKLISSAVDTLVSRSPSPESGPAKTTPAIFGPICSESFAHYDRALSSWRTSQDTFPWGVDECSLIFPKAGTMRNGVCYQQPEWEPRISAKDSSLWRTPNTMDSLPAKSQKALDHEYTHRPGRREPNNLRDQLAVRSGARRWPTPRVEDGQCAGAHRGKPDSLHAAVKIWPTPKASASASGPDYARRNRKGSGGDDLATTVGGQLNPTWVEWLMGFPAGWTALLASATPSSPKSQRRSGG